jgi:hypothetical protein
MACKTNLDDLERMQNKALRFITGQYVNTNCDIIRAEADIPSYSSHSDQLIAKPKVKSNAKRSRPPTAPSPRGTNNQETNPPCPQLALEVSPTLQQTPCHIQ